MRIKTFFSYSIVLKINNTHYCCSAQSDIVPLFEVGVIGFGVGSSSAGVKIQLDMDEVGETGYSIETGSVVSSVQSVIAVTILISILLAIVILKV